MESDNNDKRAASSHSRPRVQYARLRRPNPLTKLNSGCKLASADESVSNVGMASTSRVTVSASRTRPWPQTRCSAPPSLRELESSCGTSDEIPGTVNLRHAIEELTTTAPPTGPAPPIAATVRLERHSLGSPMVSRPWTSSCVDAIRFPNSRFPWAHVRSLGGLSHGMFHASLIQKEICATTGSLGMLLASFPQGRQPTREKLVGCPCVELAVRRSTALYDDSPTRPSSSRPRIASMRARGID